MFPSPTPAPSPASRPSAADPAAAAKELHLTIIALRTALLMAKELEGFNPGGAVDAVAARADDAVAADEAAAARGGAGLARGAGAGPRPNIQI